MARNKKNPAALIAIAGMLCFSAVAHAATDEGPQWPNFYEPRWPNIAGEPGYRPDLPAQAPAPRQEPATGSVRAPVAERWHDFAPVRVIPAFDGEFGLRYWYSAGKTAKDLYNRTGSLLVSRLTYDGLRGHSGEGYGRVDHTSGFFLKGYLGAGILTNGTLTDEDFPPVIAPYSSTDSRQRDGHLAYAAIDLGFNLWRQPGLRIGVFGGYHYLDQQVNAYGCTQTASNPAICAGGIPANILGITQNNQWHSLRVGMDATIKLVDRLSLRLDAAYLPYVKLNGSDTHWLRVGTSPGDFTGPVPEDGQGRGYQLEAALAYAASPNVNFAVGFRYWRMESHGYAHFEGHVVGRTGFPQVLDWTVENYGVFLQGGFKFGPYPTGGVF